MTTRVVLVKPPERASFNFGTYSLGVLAAAIRELAHVSILDLTAHSTEEAVAETLSETPDLVGVTAMGMDSVPPVAGYIQALKLAAPDLPVVSGGHGASGEPGRLLASGADAVVIGEGEITFRSMVKKGIRPGTPGTVCQIDGELVTGPVRPLVRPLDRLPYGQ